MIYFCGGVLSFISDMKQSGRKNRKKTKANDEKAEFRYELCYDYARCRSFSAVARKHGVHPQVVKRAWEALSNEEQQSIIDTRSQSEKHIAERIVQADNTGNDNSVETLNRKTIVAESLAEDAFVRKMMQARNALGDELLRRCDPAYIQTMEDKNFISLVRAVSAATSTPNGEEEKKAESDTFRLMREKIEVEITKQ